MMYLTTLGQLTLHRGGPEADPVLRDTKLLAVIALLATLPGHSASKDYLATLLWPDRTRTKSRNSLRQALHQLSKRSEVRLYSDGPEVRLDSVGLTVDLWEFDRAISERDFRTAVELFGGPFLAVFPGAASDELLRWIESVNDRVWAGLEVAFTTLVNRAGEVGDHARQAELAQRYRDLNPLSERATLLLIQALRTHGDETAALQVFEGYRTLVAEELGDTPGPQLGKSGDELREALLAVPQWTRRTAILDADPVRSVSTARRLLASVAGLAAVIAGTMLFLTDASTGSDAGEVGLLLRLEGSNGETSWATATIAGGAVAVGDELPIGLNGLLAPRGGLVAAPAESPNGLDIEIRDLESGELRHSIQNAGDDQPIAWAPDGARLLYSEGTALPDAAGYSRRLRSFDLVSQRDSYFGDLVFDDQLVLAAWSPIGTRIAIAYQTRLDSGLVVVDASGSEVWSRRDLAAGSPTWSPDGSSLAFAARANGVSQVRTVAADGTGFRSLSQSRANERFPVWVSPSRIVILSDRSGSLQAWEADLAGRPPRQLSEGLVISRIALDPRDSEPLWIDSLAIAPPVTTVSPGQQLRPTLQIVQASGEHLAEGSFDVSWSVEHPGVIVSDSYGFLHFVDTGETELRANLSGWRQAGLLLRSLPLIENRVPQFFEDDWTRGLRPEHWLALGDPLPYTRREGGPEGGGVFVNNGDDSYKSGAATRALYPLSEGLTVEVWGKTPFSGRHFEDFAIGFYTALPEPESAAVWNTPPLVYLNLGGIARATVVFIADRSFAPPFPESPHEWHRYAVQIGPTGTVRLIVDGKLLWEAPERFPELGASSVHVALAGNSHKTEILHGPVRIYGGERYVFGTAIGH